MKSSRVYNWTKNNDNSDDDDEDDDELTYADEFSAWSVMPTEVQEHHQ